MIFLSVIVLPAIAAFFAMVLIGLIGLPLRPKSKIFAAVWILSLALLWQIFIWALFDELFTVRASYWWGFRECVEDGLPDGWHGRLRGWSGDSFFPVPRP